MNYIQESMICKTVSSSEFRVTCFVASSSGFGERRASQQDDVLAVFYILYTTVGSKRIQIGLHLLRTLLLLVLTDRWWSGRSIGFICHSFATFRLAGRCSQ